MPIKFRCRHCRQFLGISRSRAGEITDCPKCGKTIRVPNLDGTIEPIPSPELDLDDSQLVEALGELADIGTSPSPVEMTSPPQVAETCDATVIAPAAEPLVPVEPVAPPQAVPPQPVAVAVAHDADTIIQSGADDGTIIDANDPLRALAAAEPRAPLSGTRRRRSVDNRSAWIVGIAGAFVVALLAVVWFRGGSDTQPRALEAAADNPSLSANPRVAPDAQVGSAVGATAAETSGAGTSAAGVSGQVTYVSDDGETLPDSGARILLLPKSKPGTVKLDVAGFLAGAEPVDANVARAAIRALGGDVAMAGEDGRYQLSVPAAGEYHLLVISRHRAAEPASAAGSALQTTLSAYFFRPASLLGSLSFRFDELHSSGHGLSRRDFEFAGE